MAAARKPASASTGSWWRQEYQDSGKPWTRSTSGPSPSSTRWMRTPSAETTRWRGAGDDAMARVSGGAPTGSSPSGTGGRPGKPPWGRRRGRAKRGGEGEPARAYEPVVLTGAQVPDWSAGPEVTARAPGVPTNYPTADPQAVAPGPLRSDCYQADPAPDVNGWVDPSHGDHNCYQSSQVPVRT